jgi:hypothetical protein
MRIWSMIGVSSALLLSAGAATAQSLIQAPNLGAPEIYGRGKNVSVLERDRPDYQAMGLHNGGFTIYPRLVVTVQGTNNVYDTPAKKSDVALILSPSVVAQSNWGRHSLTLNASLDQSLFGKYKSEDTTGWVLRANGRIDVHGESYINLGADTQHGFDSRGSEVTVINTIHPVAYNTQGIYIRGLYGQDRIRASIDAAYRGYQYQNTTDTLGAFIQEDTRDLHESQIGGRVDYALTPDSALFGKLTYEDTQYLHGTMNVPVPPGFDSTDKRNSTGINALFGGNFDITGLARGEIGIGYITRNYESVNYKDVSGVSAAAKVEYFPTQLLTLTLIGQRTINDSSFSATGGYFQNSVSAEADYELRRNIIVSGAGGYEHDTYPGLNRKDNVWNGQVRGRYFLTREVGVGATLSYVKRESNLAFPLAPQYDETRLAFSLVFQR